MSLVPYTCRGMPCVGLPLSGLRKHEIRSWVKYRAEMIKTGGEGD